MAVADIDHSRATTKSPQTTGGCERFNKTLLDEWYRVTFQTRLSARLDALQADLDRFVDDDTTSRPHPGRWCDGKIPMPTFLDRLALAKEKCMA